VKTADGFPRRVDSLGHFVFKYLYWFHNHGGRFIREHPRRRTIAYEHRNPA